MTQLGTKAQRWTNRFMEKYQGQHLTREDFSGVVDDRQLICQEFAGTPMQEYVEHSTAVMMAQFEREARG